VIADDEGAAGAATEQPPPPSQLKKVAAWVAGVTAVLLAIGGLAKAVTELVDLFDKDGGDGPPVQSGSVVIHEPQLRGSNAVFDTDVTATGMRGRKVRVLWTLMDGERGQPVAEEGFDKQLLAEFEPDADTVERSLQAIVPAPSTTDLVFLRVELLNEQGDRVTFDDSEPLRLGGVGT